MSNSEGKNDWFEQKKMWTCQYYGQLDGATIKELILVVDSDTKDVFPTFKVQLENGEEIEIQIMRDEEGNGPGFISGLPIPEARHPKAGDSTHFANLAALLFKKSGATVVEIPDDDRKVIAAVKINKDRETIRISEDPANPGKFLFDLTAGESIDNEATLVVPNLSEGDLLDHVTPLIEGDTVSRDALMLRYAAVLLADQDAEIWHSGGGIMLVAGFYGDTRITVDSDETEMATYGLEVSEDGGDSLLFKEGLTPSQMVNLWSEQRKKATE